MTTTPSWTKSPPGKAAPSNPSCTRWSFSTLCAIKIRDEGLWMRNKAVYAVALGVRADGTKEIPGLWLEQNEGAKFWLRVMNELKTRGVE